MIVENQKVERMPDPLDERQADMVKIAGAIERDAWRRGGGGGEPFFERTSKLRKATETAGDPEPRTPVAKVMDHRVVALKEVRLSRDRAVQVQNADVHVP